jgi:hypothetical protein
MAKETAPEEVKADVSEPTATPEEHAHTEKQFVRKVQRYARINNEPASFELFTWQHNAASALHGWREHEHHAGKPIQLTGKAYRNALRAAAEPDATGNYAPCQAALSPHCPHQRKG